MNPAVSIVLPTYNRADYVMDAVASAIGQTYTNWEMVIVDDGSTDRTLDVLSAVADRRVRVVTLPRNAGVSAARNAGIRATSAPLVAILDSDDIWLPNHLSTTVGALNANSDVAVMGSQALIMDFNGFEVKPCPMPVGMMQTLSYSMIRCSHLHSTAVLRRTCLDRVGGYDEALRKFDDLDLWLRLRRLGYATDNVPMITAIVRESRNSLMRGNGAVLSVNDDMRMLGESLADEGFASTPEVGMRTAMLAHYNPLPGDNSGCRETLRKLQRKWPTQRLFYEIDATVEASLIRASMPWRIGQFMWRALVPTAVRVRVPRMA